MVSSRYKDEGAVHLKGTKTARRVADVSGGWGGLWRVEEDGYGGVEKYKKAVRKVRGVLQHKVSGVGKKPKWEMGEEYRALG